MAANTATMNIDSVSAAVKKLVIAQLKGICKTDGLPVSGTKVVLQTRIICQLQRYIARSDFEGFSRLRSVIFRPETVMGARQDGFSPASRGAPSYSSPLHHAGHGSANSSYSSPATTSSKPQINPPHFVSSPFFTIKRALTPVYECGVREHSRDTFRMSIDLHDPALVESIRSDRRKRIMIFCAPDPRLDPNTRSLIAFPHQIELKVNQDEVKANLRGLKNKPGTTRPADITDLLRIKPGYKNELSVTYALTTTRYLLIVYVVQHHPVDELILRLQAGKRISKARVLQEMIGKAQDTDIVATSIIMSLKCPLSTLRIEVPCRSTVCSHNQCFDAASFLQLQEQAPTWSCPICSKSVSFDSMMMDEYVEEILRTAPRSVSQVTIEPDGKWRVSAGDSEAEANGRSQSTSSDEADLAELTEVRNEKMPAQRQEQMMLSTPPTSSREQSTSSGPPRSKRDSAQVVDLTLSSDDEGDAVRPTKRRQVVLEWPPKSMSSLPSNSDWRNHMAPSSRVTPHLNGSPMTFPSTGDSRI